MKNIYWYVKNLEVLSMITPLQLLLRSSFAFLEMALWFHFSENGPTAMS